MFHEKIKSLFSNAVHSVSSTISEFTVNPGSDLTRDRKLPAEKLITFLVSQGASSSKNELLDFFDLDPQAPTASALNQQRAKLRPEALEMVFRHFNFLTDSLDGTPSDYRFIAADGSTFTFFSKPSFSPSEYYPDCIIERLYIFKYKPVYMAVICDAEPAEPFPFYQGMEAFYASIVPRAGFRRIAAFHPRGRFCIVPAGILPVTLAKRLVTMVLLAAGVPTERVNTLTQLSLFICSCLENQCIFQNIILRFFLCFGYLHILRIVCKPLSRLSKTKRE